jgi:hypothetical protein
MAVNKPVGDNARKGAIKKRTQLKTKLGGVFRLDQAQQNMRGIHRGEEAKGKEKGGQEVKGVRREK